MALHKKLKPKILPTPQEALNHEKTVYRSEHWENHKAELEELLIPHNREKLIKDNILTRKDYLDLIKTREDIERFEKRIRDDDQLYFYGDTHKNDLKDLEFSRMEYFITEFFEKNKGKKNIALVEGGMRKEIDIKKEKFGTSAQFLQYFAKQNNCPVESPEPDSDEEIEYIKKQWVKKEYIAYYYVWRMISQWHRLKDLQKPSLEKYIEGAFRWNFFTKIYGEPYSLKLFQNIHTSIFEDKLDLSDADHFKRISNPYSTYSPNISSTYSTYSPHISNVSCLSWRYRDQHIVETVLNYLENGYKVMIVYGGGHLIIQHKI